MRELIPFVLLAAWLPSGCDTPAPHAGHAPSDHAAPGGHDGHGAQSLREIMVDLGQRMAEVESGLWTEDFGAIARSARAIAEHPHVSPDEVARIQGVLGGEFPSFAQADRDVHDAAVRLGDAAEARDLDGVLTELSTVQRGCTTCHGSFRARLATAAPTESPPR